MQSFRSAETEHALVTTNSKKNKETLLTHHDAVTWENQTTRNRVSLAVKAHYHSMASCHVIPHKYPHIMS
jgi:hypothetical protein